MTSIATSLVSTADPAELDKFAGLGGAWWDAVGPMAPLHKFNPVRVSFIRDQACRHFCRDAGAGRPLLEPGQGLGGNVTGIDPLPSSIAAARAHAEDAGVAVDYRAETIEAMAQGDRRFDVVIASEVVEHVPEPADFVDALARVTRPGGLLVVTTLSRTLASFVEAVVGAEYLLGWLPRGTHDWRRFITPAELSRLLRPSGFRPIAMSGASYDGARDEFRLSRDPRVNYLLAAARG